jgi:hypothetical protein
VKLRASTLVVAAILSVVPIVGGAAPCASARVAHGAAVKRAALVIQFADGTQKDFCVSFRERAITGLELLRRAGLALSYQDYGGGNVTICSIGEQGCAYPRLPCWCHCASASGACAFWGYYRMSAGTNAWHFSQEGAAITAVHDGDVEGWRWGSHGLQGAQAPRASGLAEVCSKGVHVDVAGFPAKASERRGAPVAMLVIVAGLIIVLVAAAIIRARRTRATQ